MRGGRGSRGRAERVPGLWATREHGAAAVEMALVLPLLVTLVFGMLFGGILVFRDITISDAAREATRFGATLDVDASSASPYHDWLDDVHTRAVDSTQGQVDPSVAGQDVCVALLEAGSWHRKDGSGYALGMPCWPDSRPATEDRVQVSIQRESDWNAVFWSETLTLEGRAVAIYELGG